MKYMFNTIFSRVYIYIYIHIHIFEYICIFVIRIFYAYNDDIKGWMIVSGYIVYETYDIIKGMMLYYVIVMLYIYVNTIIQ